MVGRGVFRVDNILMSYDLTVSIPLRGSCYGKVAQIRDPQSGYEVSIPLRGSCYGKYDLTDERIAEVKGFHPLAGKLLWKEFTSGKLTGQGFQIPKSTHL
jgi:hypothetical protein